MNQFAVNNQTLSASAKDIEFLLKNQEVVDFVKNSYHALMNQKQLQNIGDIGIAPDFSNNVLRNPLQNNYPLALWLLNTVLSSQMRQRYREAGLLNPHKDEEGNWVMTFPYTVGTLPPQDTSGACCWVPFDIAKCGGTFPLSLLCLKDCYPILDILINENRRAGSNDLTGYFLRPGESVAEARRRMARLSMAYLTALNLILGVSTAGTDVLKPFHGLLEILEDEAVIKIEGSNILAAFDALGCRIDVLGGTNRVLAMHPLVFTGVDKAVTPGRFNTLPAGWTRNGDVLRYKGVRIITDTVVPIDLETGTGEIWMLDGDSVGAFLGTDLIPTNSFIRRGVFTSTDDPSDGCAQECDFYYNFGGAFSSNPHRLAVIQNVPIDSNCTGIALAGLDCLLTPNTLVPMC